MANLVVTFTAAPVDVPRVNIIPLERGSVADTEQIVIGAGSVAGAKAATGERSVVSLLAEADCWIAIGSAPVAAAGSGRKMLSGERLQFWCEVGDKVAAIEAV